MTLVAHLTALEASGLIRLAEVQPELEYFFRHALVQEATYASILRQDRKKLHLAVGEAFEQLYPDRQEEFYGVLAHHFAAAGEREKGIFYAQRAAQKAEARYAYEEAIQHLRTALKLIEPGEQGETHLILLEELADVHRLLGERTRAIPIYQEALDLWGSLADAEKMIAVRLHRKIGETVADMPWVTDFQRFEAASRTSLEAGLKLMEGEPPHSETVRLMTTLSSETAPRDAWTAELNMAEHYAQAAVEMAEHLDAPVELSAALGALARVYMARGLLHERVEVSLRRLALSHDPRFSSLRARASILYKAGVALMGVGEYAQAVRHLLEAESLGRRIQAIDQQVAALDGQALCRFRLDSWDEVVKIDEKWRALEQDYPNFRERVGRTCFLIALSASVHALRGELERAGSLRQESYGIMVAGAGSPEQWGRSQHY